jgi:hypothetical protein
MTGLPTEEEIELTLALYNADHDDPSDHVLREHWDSWWDHTMPRAIMARYLRIARAAVLHIDLTLRAAATKTVPLSLDKW